MTIEIATPDRFNIHCEARTLAMQETKRIALLFDPSIGYCRNVLEGIQYYARNRPAWTFHEAVATMSSLNPLLDWRPHGIIAYLSDRAFADELIKHVIPTVNTTSVLGDFDVPLIEVDHQKVGEMAATFFS